MYNVQLIHRVVVSSMPVYIWIITDRVIELWQILGETYVQYLFHLFRSVISSGDVYNFHFIRNTKTMSIQDSCGTRYSIPFNSSITFGLVYNPFNEPFHAVRHYSFTTVGEIMTCKHPPPIFRATREFSTRDTKSSIAKEEIFILKKVCRSGKKKKQHIRVHSLKTGKTRSSINKYYRCTSKH